MSSWCLTRQAEENLMTALKADGNPQKMVDRTTEERHAFFAKYVGEENAKNVNALFESKLLLKNQAKGLKSFIEKSGGAATVKRDFLSRIESLDKALSRSEVKQFLGDYVEKRLGLDINEKDAQTITDLTKNISDLKAKADKTGVFSNENDRLAYGANKVNVEKYVNDLKLKAKSISFREEPLSKTISLVKEVPGVLKSAVASLDNSFFGRQGVKTLLDLRTSSIWIKNFVKSFGDIGKELVGHDAMDAVKTDIYSRANAVNGKYEAGGYGLDVLGEEAYPSSFPEKIPILGRLFKASESAYNGAALRLRADLADRYIKIAEKQGINTLDKTQAQGMGRLISSLTGRGSLGKAEPLSKDINAVFFSIKFLKSNFDFLTAHQLDSKATSFTKQEAAKNLLSTAFTVASVLTVAKLLNPNSVDEDPRSSNFGKIRIFGHWTDITGGMGSLLSLASRITPTTHNGVLSFWSKNSKGDYTNLLEGKYGGQTALDVIDNFWQGKLSPVAGVLRDIWKGQGYGGQPVTPEGEVGNVLTPLSISSFNQLMKDPNSSSVLGSVILDGLGFSVGTNQYNKMWSNPTKEQQAFKTIVGEEKFREANDQFNTNYNIWFSHTSQTSTYRGMSGEEKLKLTTEAKQKIEESVFKKYGFNYKPPKQTKATRSAAKQEKGKINSLIPK